MKTLPTSFAEIVRGLPMDLVYADVSGVGDEVVWLDPNYDGTNFVWCFEWPKDIQDNLISF